MNQISPNFEISQASKKEDGKFSLTTAVAVGAMALSIFIASNFERVDASAEIEANLTKVEHEISDLSLSPTVEVRVRSGDTIWEFAELAEMTDGEVNDDSVPRYVDAIQEINGLDSPLIQIGQRLKIPVQSEENFEALLNYFDNKTN